METDEILLIDQCHNRFYVLVRLLVHFLCYCFWIFLLEMDRFFPSAMTPPCRKFPAVTHEFDVCQKNLPVLIKKKNKWIELGGKRISNESDDLEPVLSWKWFSVPIPVFCDCSLPSIKRNNKHVRTLLTGYWLFFLALLLKQPLKVCFLPCSVGSEACTTSCRRTRGLIRSPNVQFATEEKLILTFFIIYICVCLIKNTSATWEYLKYTAGFLCI